MIEEPDIDRLHRAYTQLQAEPGQDAINHLEDLAKSGSLMSMIYIAWAYKNGIGVIADDKLAERWYRRAVDGGSRLATYYLGHFYLEREEYSRAEEVFSIGVLAEYSPAMFCLGCMYLEGVGVAKDLDKARFLFQKSADHGHVFARRSLAAMYMSGKYGITCFFKGLWLFIGALKDVIILARTDPNSDRLRA